MTRELAEIWVTENGCEESQMCDYESVKVVLREIFDQHEDETAQLRMEITELRQLVAEKNEQIKEKDRDESDLLTIAYMQGSGDTASLKRIISKLQDRIDELEKDEAFFNLHKDGFLRCVRNIENQLQALQEQLGEPYDTITASKDGYIDDLGWYSEAEPNAVYDVFLIKQKGE